MIMVCATQSINTSRLQQSTKLVYSSLHCSCLTVKVFNTMATRQWWRRLPNTCCSKKILLLLVWQMMIAFSSNVIILYSSIFVRHATLTAISFTVASFLLLSLAGLLMLGLEDMKLLNLALWSHFCQHTFLLGSFY